MLAALRQRTGQSQSDLARQMGISPAAVSQAERVTHPLREDTFADYTKTLGFKTELEAMEAGAAELRFRAAEQARLEAKSKRANTPRKQRAKRSGAS